MLPRLWKLDDDWIYGLSSVVDTKPLIEDVFDSIFLLYKSLVTIWFKAIYSLTE